MASAAVTMPASDKLLSNPWPWLIGGTAAAALAGVWACVFPQAASPLRPLLVFGGVLAAGVGVIIRPSSAKVLSAAAGVAILGYLGLYVREDLSRGGARWLVDAIRTYLGLSASGEAPAWDSIRLVLRVASFVALVAAVLMLLPRVARRIVVSLLIVFHFGGILSAVLSATPGSWIASVAYVYVYRSYLEFMYLTNAYHYYAPEPGPAYLLWFRIEYTKDADKSTTYWHWHKLPDLDDDGWPRYAMDLQYQRRIAAAGLAAQATLVLDPVRLPAIALRHEQENLDRYRAGRLIIPRNPNQQVLQFAEPTPITKLVIASYVRHVAFKFQQEHPEATIRNIKVYRIIHYFMGAGELAQGKDPCDPTYYHPYFWGKYDTAGKLVDATDPYLYWHLPFLKVNPDQSPYFRPNQTFPKELRPRFMHEADDQFLVDLTQATQLRDEKKYKVFSYLHLHAGDPKWVLHSGQRQWQEK